MSANLDKKNVALKCAGSTPAVTTADIASAAVLLDGHAVYATADAGNSLILLYASTAEYRASGTLSDLNQWHQISLKSHLPTSLAGEFEVEGAISAVVQDHACYVFWKSTDGVFRVLRLSFAGKTSVQLATIGLDATNCAGHPAAVLASNLAAFNVPGALKTLKGRIGFVMLYKYSTTTTLLGLTLDPAAFVANSPWQAEDRTMGLMPNLDDDGSLVAGGYTHLTAAWINQGAMQITASDRMQPYVTLVVGCHSPSASQRCRFYALPLLGTLDPHDYGRATGEAWPQPVAQISGLENGPASAATLCSAPDGTLLAKYADLASHARTASLQLNPCQPGDSNYAKPGPYSPRWIVAATDPDGGTTAISSQAAPCSLFLPLPIHLGKSPVAVAEPGSATKKTYDDCRIQKHVECVLGAAGGHPKLSTFYWGEIFAIPNYITSDLLDPYKERLMLNMVADSFPYPVPEKKIWGADSPSGMINWLLCTYEYLVGSDVGVNVETTIMGSTGLKFSETLLITTLGVQTEDSLSGGYTSITATENVSHTSTSRSVTTKGLPTDTSDGAAQGDNAELFISPEGALFGTTPISRIGFDLNVALLRGASEISEAMVWKVHPILTSPPTAISGDYATYCYTPGNLTSYQETRINGRMHDLFAALDDDAKAEFVINGQDYRPFYTGNDYLGQVVATFGTSTFGPGRDSPYLEFSFSETSIMRDEYQDTSNFKDAGRGFIDGSFYAGLASHIDENGTVGLLGLVSLEIPMAEETTSLMAGVEFSASWETTDSTSDSWGIKLGEYLNPLAPGEAYTARMYFLKPSPLWAMELKHFGFPSPGYEALPNIDLVNSCPVRVLFTVPYASDTLKARMGG